MNPHECGNTELRTSRMMVALYLDDEENYKQVIREVGGCPRCWQAIAHWAVSLVAGDRAFQAGGREQAAGFVLSEIDRVLTITNAPW